ncbi:hypothetical protein [Actinomadura sp. DC4]|uniref:hypothetical protein n=1 Tax=Actinomadura sp. DC4 TaxID=3055069 RepID=UPI0025B20630|nr:hypothetical protein [Actinomadura sp. DC4]MDN3359272.1 hypothetical protein [Actinomadura sp. DC4]
MIRRLLILVGVAFAGWVLGVAGRTHADQAHADTVPGVRLPSVVEQTEHAIIDPVLAEHHVEPAVHETEAVLAPARPPAILALPPAVKSVLTDAPRPHTPAGSAGPSRTRRHGDAGSRAGVSGGPVTHIGPHAVTGASGKASTGEHRVTKHRAHRAPSIPRRPRPLPQKGQALPPSADNGGIHQAGVRRKSEPGKAQSLPAIPILRIGNVPPAVRTAADEPSFSPD